MDGIIDAVLGAKLEPLQALLKRRGLVELNANRPGEVWLEFADGRRAAEKAPASPPITGTSSVMSSPTAAASSSTPRRNPSSRPAFPAGIASRRW